MVLIERSKCRGFNRSTLLGWKKESDMVDAGGGIWSPVNGV
jgi:hypothetical protein